MSRSFFYLIKIDFVSDTMILFNGNVGYGAQNSSLKVNGKGSALI